MLTSDSEQLGMERVAACEVAANSGLAADWRCCPSGLDVYPVGGGGPGRHMRPLFAYAVCCN